MRAVKSREHGYYDSDFLGGFFVVFILLAMVGVILAVPLFDRFSSSEKEYALLSYTVKEEVQKLPALSGGDYKMVIGDQIKTKADFNKNNLKIQSEREEFEKQLRQLESFLDNQMKENKNNVQNARPVVHNDQYQLISDHGVLKFVNYNGEEFKVLSPQTARDGLISQKEIYDRIVTPIEKYLILHPAILSEDLDIVVGNGKRDMDVPPYIEKEYDNFSSMLEDNLSRLLEDKQLVDNPLIAESQYQFYAQDGEWELVNYNGKVVDLKKMRNQSIDKISLDELAEYGVTESASGDNWKLKKIGKEAQR